MEKINDRFGLELRPRWGIDAGPAYSIVDLYRNQSVGSFWQSDAADGLWIFQLDDGRSRFGGKAKVLRSLKAMCRVK